MWDLISWPGIKPWPPALGACNLNHWTTSPCLGFWSYVFYCVWVLSHFSRVWLFVTLWTVACQAPLSMGFSRQEHCSGIPCTPLGDPPDPGIKNKPAFLMSSALADGFFTTSSTWEAQNLIYQNMQYYLTTIQINNNELFTCQSYF